MATSPMQATQTSHGNVASMAVAAPPAAKNESGLVPPNIVGTLRRLRAATA